MAKKPAASKKVTSSKVKTTKATKPVAKPAKPVKAPQKKSAASVKTKAQVKTSNTKQKIEKTPAIKPAMMTKKGKSVEPEVAPIEVKKTKTITSLIEESPVQAVDPSKVEKISKVKPVRVERGNLADEKAKWAELYKKYGKEKAAPYKMSESFMNLSPLQHKVLGWGFILTNENDRLEVLFETGIRMLISNYKS